VHRPIFDCFTCATYPTLSSLCVLPVSGSTLWFHRVCSLDLFCIDVLYITGNRCRIAICRYPSPSIAICLLSPALHRLLLASLAIAFASIAVQSTCSYHPASYRRHLPPSIAICFSLALRRLLLASLAIHLDYHQSLLPLLLSSRPALTILHGIITIYRHLSPSVCSPWLSVACCWLSILTITHRVCLLYCCPVDLLLPSCIVSSQLICYSVVSLRCYFQFYFSIAT